MPAPLQDIESNVHEFVGLNSLLFVTLVCICLVLGYNLKKHQVYYLPESGASMLFGLLVGGVVTLFGHTESEYVTFDPEVFFFVLLPPIIFEAGFTLKRRNFFRNMGTILMFAVLGTVVSTLVIGYGLYGLAKLKLVPLRDDNPMEALLFGSLISAVDPVATLSILGAKEINADPLLYSIVFGESVLNDAVSVVLFKTFSGYYVQVSEDEAGVFDGATFGHFLGTFIGVSLGSLIVGCVTALLCSFLLKQADLKHHPAYEFTVLFLFAYGTYCLAEILELSGIVALFFCGITMAHYALYNVSAVTQTSTHHVFKSIAMLSETFVFAYLGIYAGISLENLNQKWSPLLIVFTILLCFISRALNIFPFSFLANLTRKRKIPFKMQIAMWFAGLRGAIAFALAVNIPTENTAVITTTLTIVFFTTLVCGGLTERILSLLNLRKCPDTEPREIQDQPLINEDHGSSSLRRRQSVLHDKWRHFDDKFMKRYFGGQAHHPLEEEDTVIVDDEDFSVYLPEPHEHPPVEHLEMGQRAAQRLQETKQSTVQSNGDHESIPTYQHFDTIEEPQDTDTADSAVSPSQAALLVNDRDSNENKSDDGI